MVVVFLTAGDLDGRVEGVAAADEAAGEVESLSCGCGALDEPREGVDGSLKTAELAYEGDERDHDPRAFFRGSRSKRGSEFFSTEPDRSFDLFWSEMWESRKSR